ncbi:response regulator transcription factor [Solicola gregarius]
MPWYASVRPSVPGSSWPGSTNMTASARRSASPRRRCGLPRATRRPHSPCSDRPRRAPIPTTTGDSGGPAPRARLQPPLAPLSDSELRVLRYLPTNLTAPEVARELYVSANTVKTHMRNVYAKLAVHRRAEAVERARALGLLAPSAAGGTGSARTATP